MLEGSADDGLVEEVALLAVGEGIVRAATELLDDEGLGGLNMRSLGARLGTADTDRAAATVFVYVLGSALGAAVQVSLTRRPGKSGDPEKELADTMAAATEVAMYFPRLSERLDGSAAAKYTAAPDRTFEFGLAAILDGFEAQLAETS
ncbi:TetR/AcrR family transcriptional regulator C-terminal domain-containing protein [Streptomyces sp. NPDC085481]|uniref:TetR/AcrR family transcriptional regulator C-terminal domain-containing protein n=1 Tax=Streptomyces sp. NPDC085481 TaxID=3365727 RepID=UPI0037D139A8